MRSEPIPLDIFGDVDLEHIQIINEDGTALTNGWIAPKEMNNWTPAQHANTASADTTTYRKGDLAWYRQRDGMFVPAKVVSVDLTVEPPSYAVDLEGNIRETEAPRLRPRGPGETAPPLAVSPGGNPFGVHAPLAPLQKDVASCGPLAAVSVHASSGDVSVRVSVPMAASSADSWLSADAGFADSTWHAAGAQAAAEEDEDFGDFCDADVSAASVGSSGAALALRNGVALPKLQPDQQSAWFGAQPPLAGMQQGSGATGASFGNGLLHLPAPAALTQVHLQAAAGSRAEVLLSFASFDAFRPSAHAVSSAGAAECSRLASAAAAGPGMDPLPGAAASSFREMPSWPAAVPAHSALHQLGSAAAANGGTEDFGDFEAANWQAHMTSFTACAASGPAQVQGKADEAAQKSEAGPNGGGRGVTPASTIDIARDELDFSEASDEDDFGDFEDAASGSLPTEAPAAANAPALDRSAPLPMSLFGEECDPAEATPPLPSLDLAAPWGGFGFDQVLPDQAPPAAHISTPAPALAPASHLPHQAHPSIPAPTFALPSQAPDQATVSPLGSTAAMQLPSGAGVPAAFPACAPATPLPSEHAPCAADATLLSGPGLSAEQQGTPGTAAPLEAEGAASGMSQTAANSAGSDVFVGWAAPSEPGMLDAQVNLDAREDSGAEISANAQLEEESSLAEPEAVSSEESAAVSATEVAEGNNQGSGQGINWDALDFSFADDVPDQAPEATSDAFACSARHGIDTSVVSTEVPEVAGPMENEAVEHSIPSGAVGQEETAIQSAAMIGAALLESPEAQHAQLAEQQEAADDEESEDWGDFEEFPAPETSANAPAEAAAASPWDGGWSGEPTKSSNAAMDWPAASVAGPDHAHELAQFPVLAAPGASSGVPSSLFAPNQDPQGVTWPAETAVEASSTAELALLHDVAAAQPSAGVPSHPAAPDWDVLDGGLSGSFPTAGADINPPSQPQDAGAAGICWDSEDPWLATEAEMRPALPSADLWNTLASCDPSKPAPDVESRVGSVSQGDDMFDEGLWGEDWAAAGSSRLGPGLPDLLDDQANAAAALGTSAGHDRATALRLLAKAAEAELAEGQRIWSEACSSGCQASFCAGAAERQYITALGAVYFVAAALQGGCAIGGVDDAATAGSLMRCQECWHGQMSGMPSLRIAYEAAAAEAKPLQLSAALAEACGVLEALTGPEEEGTRRTDPCCAITCLPLSLCPAVPAVQIEGESCWAPVANLWVNRVQPALQDAHQL